jgi:hypothetical protein
VEIRRRRHRHQTQRSKKRNVYGSLNSKFPVLNYEEKKIYENDCEQEELQLVKFQENSMCLAEFYDYVCATKDDGERSPVWRVQPYHLQAIKKC